MSVTGDRRRRRRTIAAAIAGATALALVLGVVAIVAVLRNRPVSTGCLVKVGSTSYAFDLDQAQNATTIAAVGRKLQMPDHAVTVALAAALQESNLHNLAYGDRDSLGLFQQRPSQGWGTAQQLQDPTYAASAFYRALTRIASWRSLPVTVAAQRVQRSAAPDAYAKWEPQARSLAIALTGEQGAAFACHYPIERTRATAPSYATALGRETGVNDLAGPFPGAQAWALASWLVGHASDYRITSVTLQGRRWTASSGAWHHASTPEGGIQVEQGS